MIENHNQRPTTALIIDDSYYNRDIFRTILENENFAVTDLEDSVEGIRLLETTTFNMLILDLQMPIADGRTVLGTIRPNPLHKAMVIIVVTAYPHMETADIEEKADYIMHKPINVAHFAAFARRIQHNSYSANA